MTPVQENNQRTDNLNKWFYLFIIVHLIVWTLMPILVRYNLPLDSIEGTVWGHQLEWGYDKNPFMNGWLTALAVFLGGSSGWMIYLFSQLSVIACFWSVWQIAKQMLVPAYALVAVMLLEGVQYYNLHAIDFNDNTLELGLWGLTCWYFYQALAFKQSRSLHWILTGLFAGLALMAKYYTLALLAGMALFLFTDRENRKQLVSLPPCLGLLVFLAVILPHVVWLFHHDFVTVKYVFARASSQPHWTNHLFFPAQFAWQMMLAFLPAVVMVLFAVRLHRSPDEMRCISSGLHFCKFNANTVANFIGTRRGKFNNSFLFYVGLCPFLLTVLLSCLTGIKLRAGWGMPLLSLWGVILVAYLQTYINLAHLKRFITAVYSVMILIAAGYATTLINSNTPSSANFAGRELAALITDTWHDTYHTPLSYVAGSRWLGGNISFYSPDHPAVYMEWNKQRAPWINQHDLETKGAVFVWDIDDHETLPDEIRAAYPALKEAKIIELHWKRNCNRLAPARIGVAMLPPQSKM